MKKEKADERTCGQVLAATVMGRHGLIPNGIPLVINREDEGQWWLGNGCLSRDRQFCN